MGTRAVRGWAGRRAPACVARGLDLASRTYPTCAFELPGHWQRGLRELPVNLNTGISFATVHKSVYARFAAAEVVQYDVAAPYRPVNLKNHVDFSTITVAVRVTQFLRRKPSRTISRPSGNGW